MKNKIYSRPSKEFTAKFNNLVGASDKIVITSHMSPDDDAISCALTCYKYITKYIGKNKNEVRIIITGARSDRWDGFENYEKVIFADDLYSEIRNADLLVMLDGSGWNRFSRNNNISEFNGVTICIDHHPNSEDTHDLHLVDTSYASCAEIVYQLFFKNRSLEKSTAESLFLGIWGDTGGLRYVKPENTSTFDTVKKLIKVGNINVQSFTAKYMKLNFKMFELITYLMRNTKIETIKGWPSMMYAYLPVDIYNGRFSDIEVAEAYHVYTDQYLRMVKGADWGFVATPKENSNEFRFSLRSLPESVNVRLVAEALGGGGHDRAAGFKLEIESHTNALNRLFDWMKKNKPVIN